jgi:hypothetical protein
VRGQPTAATTRLALDAISSGVPKQWSGYCSVTASTPHEDPYPQHCDSNGHTHIALLPPAVTASTPPPPTCCDGGGVRPPCHHHAPSILALAPWSLLLLGQLFRGQWLILWDAWLHAPHCQPMHGQAHVPWGWGEGGIYELGVGRRSSEGEECVVSGRP